MKPLKAAFFLGLFGFLALPLLQAAPQTSIRFENYSIQGRSLQELRDAMQRNNKTPEGYYAFTKWDIRWYAHWAPASDGCRFTDIRVTLDVVYRMPEWSGAKNADASLRKKWAAYITALRVHEDGHKNFGAQAAQAIENRLNHFGAVPNCGQMQDAANSAVQAVIKEYQQKEIKYDRDTQHGLTQGARL